MKGKVVIGFLAVSLLLWMAGLARPGGDQQSGPRHESASVPPKIPGAADVRRIESSDLPSAAETPSLEAMLLAIESEPDLDRRSEIFDRAVESVAEADLPAALDALARSDHPAAVELGQLLVGRWAERDAPAAAGWAAELPEGPVRLAALGQAAIAWTATDFAAAVKWLHSLPEGESKQAATLDMAYEIARTDPIPALDLAAALPPGGGRDDLLVHAVSQWTGTDPAAALTWAMKVPDTYLRRRLLAAVAVARAEQDSADAAMVAANVLAAGEIQNCTVVAVVQRWAEGSPKEAAAWVAQFPDLPVRGPALQNLLALWIPQDAAGAKDWLDGLPPGPLQSAGLSVYSQVLANNPAAP